MPLFHPKKFLLRYPYLLIYIDYNLKFLNCIKLKTKYIFTTNMKHKIWN